MQTTTIVVLATPAVAAGEGTILTPESHQEQVAGMLGFGKPVSGCVNCRTMNEQYNYGLRVVLHGNWILQNPLFAGYGAIGAYLPPKQNAAIVAMTYGLILGAGLGSGPGGASHGAAEPWRCLMNLDASESTSLAPLMMRWSTYSRAVVCGRVVGDNGAWRSGRAAGGRQVGRGPAVRFNSQGDIVARGLPTDESIVCKWWA